MKNESRVRFYLGEFPVPMSLCDYGFGYCFISSLDNMAIDSPQDTRAGILPPGFNVENVPVGTGRPTREELLAHYPAKFTWTQLKTFVNSGYAQRNLSRIKLLTMRLKGPRPLEKRQETSASL